MRQQRFYLLRLQVLAHRFKQANGEVLREAAEILQQENSSLGINAAAATLSATATILAPIWPIATTKTDG